MNKFFLVETLKGESYYNKFRILLKYKLLHWEYFRALFIVIVLVNNIPTETISESDLECLYRL